MFFFINQRYLVKTPHDKWFSEDFVYSFNRILDQKIASPGSWIFKNVRNLKFVNDTVLKIKLKNKSK